MGGRIKKAEEFIYEAVERGEMEIDPDGRIWRTAKRGWDRWAQEVRTNSCARVRAETLLPSGYLMVRAMVDKKRLSGLAHRLVWFHFNGPIPDGMEVNHRNGIKQDNRPTNLEVLTPAGNMQHAVRILGVGRTAHQDGENNHAAKLTTVQVQEIRRRRRNGELLRVIAEDYPVRYQQISRIVRGDRRASG